MAIRRKGYVDTLDQLLSDLPKYLLEMNKQNESFEIERQKLQASEDAAYAELMLGNLNLQIEVAKSDMTSDKRMIESIDSTFKDSTKNMPSYDDLEYTPNAVNALEGVIDNAKGPLKDALMQRSKLANDLVQQAHHVNTLKEQKLKDRDALGYLKADMTQNLVTIASMGGDVNMVDPEDFAPYWEQTLLPALKEEGYIENERDAARYQDVWSGMLAPESKRMQDRQTILAHKKDKITQMINENNLIDIDPLWNELTFEAKEGIIDIQQKKVNRILTPMVDAMGVGKVGTLVDKKQLFEELKLSDPAANEDMADWVSDLFGFELGDNAMSITGEAIYWNPSTQSAYMAYYEDAIAFGKSILGDIDPTGEASKSFQPWQINNIYVDVAEEYMKAYLKASDEKGTSKDLMDLMKGFTPMIENQFVLGEGAAAGQLINTGNKRNMARQDKQDLLKDLYGLDILDYEGNIIPAMVELYEWTISKQAESVLDSFTPKSDIKNTVGDEPSFSEPQDIGYLPANALPQSSFGNKKLDQEIDRSIDKMMLDIENDWIV